MTSRRLKFSIVLLLHLAVPIISRVQGQVFRAGVALSDISPTNFPVLVNAMFTERTATNVVDPLYARALVLDDGANRIAITVVDSCMLPRDMIDGVKAVVAAKTGIRKDRILISSTHTHSAPSAMGCLGSRADSNYVAFLPPRIVEAIVNANARLVPAKIGWTVLDDWNHTFNRRWIRRPDKMVADPFGNLTARAHMHPGHESPDAVGPSGPIDPALSIVAVQAADGKPLAVLANYSQHYYESALLSSDYYGKFAIHLTSLLGATNSDSAFLPIMSQGTSGDQMWMDYGAPRKQIGYDAYAREIAEEVAQAYRTIVFKNWVPLRMAERTLKLNYRAPDEARLEWARKIAATFQGRIPQTLPEVYALEAIYFHERPSTELVLQALRIGNLGIAAIPNEVFGITGLKLKAQSPLSPTINIELANGAEGYIPPPEQHKLGGYTTWPARTAGLEVGAEPQIVAALLGLLEEVADKSKRPVVVANGVYAKRILDSRPVAYWRLDEMIIPKAADASGHGNDALIEDGVALYLPGVGSGDGISPKPQLVPSNFSGTGQINRAMHFAGGRLRANVPALTKTYSAEFWFWNGLPNEARPVTGYLFSRGKNHDPDANGDHLGIGGTHSPESTGRLIFFNGNKANNLAVGHTVIRPKSWHHIVLMREASKVSVYLDGNIEPEISTEIPSTVPDRDAELFLGGKNDGVAGLEGKLDEIAIFDRALSGQEAHEHSSGPGLP